MGLTRIRAEQISDIDYKQAVRVISLANVTLAGGAPATVDGVSLVAGDRVLVNGQSNAAQNGLYQVQTVGAGSNGTWVRTSDANADGEIQPGMVVMVTQGDEYADTPWKLVTNGVIEIGVTELVFEENYSLAFGNVFANGTAVIANTVSAGVTFTAGDNISIVGNNTAKSITIGVIGGGTTSRIANGTSNVDIAVADGNVTTTVNGNTTLTTTDTGANVTGYVTVTGNVTGGNLETTGRASIDDLIITGDVTGNLVPSANITYDLGSDTARWNDLWLANSTIYIGNGQISANATSLVLSNPDGSSFSGGGGGTPGGANTQVQFNDGGSFGGTAGFTFDKTTNAVSTSGTITATGNITGGNLITAGNVIGSVIGNVTGNVTGNLEGTANVATFVYVTESPDDNVTYNIPYLSPSGAANAPRSVYSDDTGLRFNPSTNTLTVSIGAITTISATTITVGTLNATTAIDLGDNDILRLGASDDWEMYHAAGGNNTMDLNTGDLVIRDDGTTGDPTRFTFGRTTGDFTATGNVTGGNLITAGLISATGNITGGNLITAGTLSAASFTATGNITGGNLITGGLVQATGNVTGGNLTTAGQVSATGNVSGGNIIAGTGSGGNITGANVITANAVTATGNVTGGNIVTAGLVSAGTTVTATGNVTGGNLTTAGQVSATGNVTGGNLAGTSITGTLLTAAQTNITSVGTLGSLTVTGNISGGNLTTAGAVTGNGRALTSLNATNLDTGTVPSARLSGTYTITVSGSATTAGTVTTAAQPNITSVGTLTSLTVTGNVSGGNLTTAGAVTGNGRALTSLNATNLDTGTVPSARLSGTYTITVSGSATTAGTVTTAAQPNITSVGTLTSLTSSGNIQGANVIATADVFTPEIVKTGSNGAGNIGQSNNTFNTVFAKATSAQYADVAECYLADHDYPIGTVLVFGGTQEVTQSQIDHTTAIAGTVSDQPAYVMNSGLTGEHVATVALLGRVPVRVIGTIRPGDLLVASELPGVATSLVPDRYQPGCVIGKALESYGSEREGRIEAVVGRL